MNQRNEIDENKICFVICSNNALFLEECLFYISRLEVPLGYKVETISIQDAQSMTSGYNEGMNATNAKYKIYLHQDVFIVYRKFLQAVLEIFKSDPNIGMIGAVGTPKISVDGVMWNGYRVGALCGVKANRGNYDSYVYKLPDGLHEVDAVDGFIIITCIDIPWREDIFDGWDFYDISQSLEFKNRGYKIVVPEQDCAWCKHDDGKLNFINYDKYRKRCLSQYPEYFYPKRFLTKKIAKKVMFKQHIRIVIIVKDLKEQLKGTLESISFFYKLNNSQIIIVDNGSQDGLHHWLKQQKEYNYIICGEMIEGYAAILNEVKKQFIEDEDLLILTPDLMMLPESLAFLSKALGLDNDIGAVFGKSAASYKEAIKYNLLHKEDGNKKEVWELPFQGVLIRNKMLKTIDFDEFLMLPQNIMYDYAFCGIKKGFKYYEVSNNCFCQISDNNSYYMKIMNANEEREVIRKKWGVDSFITMINELKD